jgi:hypothetical protein
VELLSQAKFGSDDLDDLTQGFTPFLFNHRAYGMGAKVEALAMEHDNLLSGHTAPTLAERRGLKQDGVSFPSFLPQADGGFNEYSCACDVALGVNHRLSVYFRHVFLAGSWVRCKHSLQNFAYESYGIHPIPWLPHLFRSAQLKLVNYFDLLVRPHLAPIPLPDLTALITLLLERSFTLLPGIPDRYLVPAAPLQPLPYSPLPPLPPPPPPYSPLQRNQPPALPSHGPTPSAPSFTAPIDRRSNRSSNMLTNPALDPAYQQRFIELGLTIRSLKENAKAPRKAHGKGPICMSYFLKGVCFDNCGSICDNLEGHTMDAGEKRRFDDFLNEVVVVAHS